MTSQAIVCVGLSHKTAPIGVREKIAIGSGSIPEVLTALQRATPLREVAVLSTCNRVEIYGAATDGGGAAAVTAIRRILPENRGVAVADVAPVLFGHAGGAAVRHVFRVAAALDSLVVGEAQILGQLKAAYHAASEAHASGRYRR